MWIESKIKGMKGYKEFLKKDSMFILHIIPFANKEAFMVVNENAFDIPKPKLTIMSKEDIFEKYNIKL